MHAADQHSNAKSMPGIYWMWYIDDGFCISLKYIDYKIAATLFVFY